MLPSAISATRALPQSRNTEIEKVMCPVQLSVSVLLDNQHIQPAIISILTEGQK